MKNLLVFLVLWPFFQVRRVVLFLISIHPAYLKFKYDFYGGIYKKEMRLASKAQMDAMKREIESRWEYEAQIARFKEVNKL